LKGRVDDKEKAEGGIRVVSWESIKCLAVEDESDEKGAGE